jgi:AraC-like DNA-binding protein/ligand-binding sensor protein
MSAHEHNRVIRALEESEVYRVFAEAFSQTTGLPVSLTPVESWQLAHQGQSRENPFCSLLAQQGPSCAGCLRAQHSLAGAAFQGSRTIECPHGLCETAVPVRAGEHLLGFVRTGQVFRRAPTAAGFASTLERLRRWGVKLDPSRLKEAYFATRVVPDARYRSAVRLLEFLAEHLSLLSNQVQLQQAHEELPLITRAKEFIEAHYNERLTLRQVAAEVHSSHWYFCKQFKLATGLGFTHYIARLRVEKAKHLLLNPHRRASEVAFAAGFQSLNHFNRTFKRVVGFSPTAYRARLETWRTGAAGEGAARSHRARTQVQLVRIRGAASAGAGPPSVAPRSQVFLKMSA